MSCPIIKKLCPAGLKNNPNKNLRAINYITIHCTGNHSATATAQSHANYLYGGSGGGQMSWHYTVDKDNVYQSFEDNRACWHAGDGSGDGNMASIGIEVCVNDKSGFPQACDNAAYLTAELLKKHGLGIDRVVQHNRWSGKNCPAEIRSGAWGVTWAGFIAMVKGYLELSDVGTPILSKPTVSIEQMMQWARDKKASDLFAELAATFYKVASAAGVNPAVAYCQSAYETGYGTFKNALLDASYKNPCGLKTSAGGGDNDANAHMRFASWEQGIQAQVDHLALYAGAAGYPKAGTPDPRHFSFIKGTAKTVEALSGKWATNPPTYGDRIAEMMREIAAIKVVAPVQDNEPSDWARPAWEWAKEKKIIVGGDPKAGATREQVAQMLFAALGGK